MTGAARRRRGSPSPPVVLVEGALLGVPVAQRLVRVAGVAAVAVADVGPHPVRLLPEHHMHDVRRLRPRRLDSAGNWAHKFPHAEGVEPAAGYASLTAPPHKDKSTR